MKYTPFKHIIEDGFLVRICDKGSLPSATIDLNNHTALKNYIVELDNAMWAARHHHTELENKHKAMVENIESALGA